jgi:hydroxymethylpyrimidine pyrophosphatase-like HAD family hydrolase
MTRRLVALDIDGTLVGRDGKVPTGTVDALDLVRAAGHEVVLATGRSLAGLLPIATRLGLTQGYAVCSNGSMTVRLNPQAPSGYVIDDAREFAPGPVIRQALARVPDARVGVEEVGWGWRVNAQFDPELLNGEQKLVPVTEMAAAPATRLALYAPTMSSHSAALAATGVTVTPAGPNWLDVVGAATSKATALERIRRQLRVSPAATVAVGDGINDVEMLAWAGRGVAMGHAPAGVRNAADETTGTIDQHGAVTVLRSLVPADVGLDVSSRLVNQLATAVRSAPDSAVVVRVWHGPWAALLRCEIWSQRKGAWVQHAPVPAGTGATMRGIESAAREAGLVYPRGREGRRRAQWRACIPDNGSAGFELPLER